MTLCFGDCTLDTKARRLTRAGCDVHLTPRAYELLWVLVERRPEALSKAHLHDHLWPGTFVADDSLARLVSEVRQAIGDEARGSRLVRTVHAFGYAFVGDVQQAPDPLREPVFARGTKHWLCWEGRERLLRGSTTVIGRDPEADVQLESGRVSRRHARIVIEGDVVRVEDLGSRNGTFVGGQRIEGPTPLAHGDEIGIGPFILTYRTSARALTTEADLSS